MTGRAQISGLLLALLGGAGGVEAASFEGRWGLEASRAALIAGEPVPELDQLLDTQRVIDSTITFAEKQGTYRAKLTTQPTCYDPSQPERMPWYVAPYFEWRERVLFSGNVYFRSAAAWGNDLAYEVNFGTGQVQMIGNMCNAPAVYEVSPAIGANLCDVDAQSPPNDRILQRELRSLVTPSGWNWWLPSFWSNLALDDSLAINVNPYPSCDSGLVGRFYINDLTYDCGNTGWAMGAQWYMDVKISLWELWDATPELYPDCFYPGRYYEPDTENLPDPPWVLP